MPQPSSGILLFFYNDTASTEIYTLSLHDALPICFDFGCDLGQCFFPRNSPEARLSSPADHRVRESRASGEFLGKKDRKSTRLNSSHTVISYAVFCLYKSSSHGSHAYSLC